MRGIAVAGTWFFFFFFFFFFYNIIFFCDHHMFMRDAWWNRVLMPGILTVNIWGYFILFYYIILRVFSISHFSPCNCYVSVKNWKPKGEYSYMQRLFYQFPGITNITHNRWAQTFVILQTHFIVIAILEENPKEKNTKIGWMLIPAATVPDMIIIFRSVTLVKAIGIKHRMLRNEVAVSNSYK